MELIRRNNAIRVQRTPSRYNDSLFSKTTEINVDGGDVVIVNDFDPTVENIRIPFTEVTIPVTANVNALRNLLQGWLNEFRFVEANIIRILDTEDQIPVSDRLQNKAGVLYWNGSPIGSSNGLVEAGNEEGQTLTWNNDDEKWERNNLLKITPGQVLTDLAAKIGIAENPQIPGSDVAFIAGYNTSNDIYNIMFANANALGYNVLDYTNPLSPDVIAGMNITNNGETEIKGAGRALKLNSSSARLEYSLDNTFVQVDSSGTTIANNIGEDSLKFNPNGLFQIDGTDGTLQQQIKPSLKKAFGGAGLLSGVVTITTIDTPVQMPLIGYIGYGDGIVRNGNVLEYTGANPIRVKVEWNARFNESTDNGDDFRVLIYKNGTPIGVQGNLVFSGTFNQFVASSVVTDLEFEDEISIYVENQSATTNIDVLSGTIQVIEL